MIATTPPDNSIVVDALKAGLPDRSVVLDSDVLTAYSIDRAMYCPAGKALALVHARSTADVQHVMRVATEHHVPVVPQGARSGLSDVTTRSPLVPRSKSMHLDVPGRRGGVTASLWAEIPARAPEVMSGRRPAEVRPTRVRNERYPDLLSDKPKIRVVGYSWQHDDRGIT